jgi:hypothetical protein
MGGINKCRSILRTSLKPDCLDQEPAVVTFDQKAVFTRQGMASVHFQQGIPNNTHKGNMQEKGRSSKGAPCLKLPIYVRPLLYESIAFARAG